MLNCVSFQEHLLDFVYGLLEGDELAALTIHLADCTECQRALALAKSQQGRLGKVALAVPVVPEFSLPTRESEVAASTEAPTTPSSAHPVETLSATQRSRSWIAWAMAASLLIGVGSAYLYHHQQRPTLDAQVALSRDTVQSIDAKLANWSQQRLAKRGPLESKIIQENLQVSVAGPARFHSEGGGNIQVRNLDTSAKPVPASVSIRLENEQRKTVAENFARIPGEAKVAVPSAPPGKYDLVVEATSEACKSVVRQPVEVAPREYTVHVALDRTLALPKENIRVRALVLDRGTLKPAPSGIPVQITLVDASGRSTGNPVNLTTTDGGIAVGVVPVGDRFVNGNYQVNFASVEPRRYPFAPVTNTIQLHRNPAPNIDLQNSPTLPGQNVQIVMTPRSNQRGTILSNTVQEIQAPRTVQVNDRVVPAQQNLRASSNIQNVPGFAPAALAKKLEEGAQMNSAPAYFHNQMQRRTFQSSIEPQAELNFKLPEPQTGSRAVVTIPFADGKNSVTVQVPVVPNKVAVDLFPEGGVLLAGVSNKVYYRVRSLAGETVDFLGNVRFTAENQVLLDQKHEGAGFGSFYMEPKLGSKLRAQLKSPSGESIVEDALQNLPVVSDGVALHVPVAVDTETQPIQGILRRKGGGMQTVVTAECRGQVLDQQWLELREGENAFRLEPKVSGIVKVTAYEILPERLRPLAQRLVFRMPSHAIDFKVGAEASPGGVDPTVNLKIADVGAKNIDAWCLASVVSDSRELAVRSLADQIMIANEVSNHSDLDDLLIVPVASDAGKNALDLFLGVHGWRGIRENLAEDATLEFAAAVPSTPMLFAKDNISLSAMRAKVHKAVEEALTEWNAQWARTYAELVESQRVAQAQLRQAIANLEAHDRQPAEVAWLAAVAVLLVSLAAAILFGISILAGWLTQKPGWASLGLAGVFGCFLLAIASGSFVAFVGPDLVQMPSQSTPEAMGRIAFQSKAMERQDARHGQLEKEADASRTENARGSFAVEARNKNPMNLMPGSPMAGSAMVATPKAAAPMGAAPLATVAKDPAPKGVAPGKIDGAVSGPRGGFSGGFGGGGVGNISSPSIGGGFAGVGGSLSQSRFRQDGQSSFDAASARVDHSSTREKRDAFGNRKAAADEKKGAQTDSVTANREFEKATTTLVAPSAPAAVSKEAKAQLEMKERLASPKKKTDGIDRIAEKDMVRQKSAEKSVHDHPPWFFAYKHLTKVEPDLPLWHPNLKLENGEANVRFELPRQAGSYRILILGHSADGRFGYVDQPLDLPAPLPQPTDKK